MFRLITKISIFIYPNLVPRISYLVSRRSYFDTNYQLPITYLSTETQRRSFIFNTELRGTRYQLRISYLDVRNWYLVPRIPFTSYHSPTTNHKYWSLSGAEGTSRHVVRTSTIIITSYHSLVTSYQFCISSFVSRTSTIIITSYHSPFTSYQFRTSSFVPRHINILSH